jgi:ribonucleotide monophosphatase NagD (HAD superfamily)
MTKIELDGRFFDLKGKMFERKEPIEVSDQELKEIKSSGVKFTLLDLPNKAIKPEKLTNAHKEGAKKESKKDE